MRHWRTVEGWLLEEEAAVLSKYAKYANVIVELGSYCGKSTIVLHNEQVGTFNAETRLYAVDTFDGRATNNIRDTYKEFISNTFGSNIIPIKMSTTDFSQVLPNDYVDLLFIDADHSYNAVKEDFENYISKVKSMGIIIFHDAVSEDGGTVNTPWQGVTDLYLELLKDNRLQHLENVKRCAVFRRL